MQANADRRDMGSIPNSGRFPGGGHGHPLQYSCLENPVDRGAWLAMVRRVSKSQTQLSDFTLTFHFHALEKERQPTPVFLPGESRGWRSLMGCRLWGRTESDTTEATEQQQQQQQVQSYGCGAVGFILWRG